MTDNKLQVVFEVKDNVESFLYRTMLQEAGIDVFERPLMDPMILGAACSPRGVQLVQLLVKSADAMRAAALIADFESKADTGEYRIDDETPAQAEVPIHSDDNPRASISYGRMGLILAAVILLSALAVRFLR